MRLIDGKKLAERFMKLADKYNQNGQIEPIAVEMLYISANIVASAPVVDAVPVVRCRDCERRGTSTCYMQAVDKDGYCERGVYMD